MSKKINYTEEELKELIIKEYKEFANKLGRTPKQQDIINERKMNDNFIVTMHKINTLFKGIHELNIFCELPNYTTNKRTNKKKKTHEDFVAEVNKVAKNKYEFITEYKSSYENITIKCLMDGYIWDVNPHSFLSRGCRCPKCSKKIYNKDTNYFKKEVEELWDDEYTVLGGYTDAKTKISMIHNTCGNEFSMTPDSFLNKHSECPKCSHRRGADKLFTTHDQFISKFKEAYGESYIEYDIMSQYKGNKENITVKHKICDNTYEQQAGDILQGKKCRYCCGTMKKTKEQFEQELYNVYGEEYMVIGEYINSKTPILIKHNICGETSNFYPTNILRKKSVCSCNTISQGEFQIKRFLEFNKMNYKQEYTFDDLKDKDYLRFDFAIFDKDSKLICLLEFDGAQHYSPVQFGGISKKEADSNFNDTKRRDQLKNDYCIDNSISLLRISHKDINKTDKILQDYFKSQLNLLTSYPKSDFMIWNQDITLRFINLLDNFPNGVYPKDFIIQYLSNEKPMHNLLKRQNIKVFIKSKNINITKDMIIISCNHSDYEQYFNFINNFEFRFKDKLIKVLKVLYYMPIGRFYKRQIEGFKDISGNNIFPSKYFKNSFVEQFLRDNNVLISSYYIEKSEQKQ